MNIFSLILSFITFFTSMLPFGAVDEMTLSRRYQSGEWSGNQIVSHGHLAEVKNGLLFVDNERSRFPADSSVANNSEPILSDTNGTWFEDHQRNEIRCDSRGKNIFTFRLKDAYYLKTRCWKAQLKGEVIYLYNEDNSEIGYINTTNFGTPLYMLYGEETIFGTL